MSTTMMIHEELKLNSDIAEVWNLLTNPEMTKKYMYGCEVLSDWQLGSPIIWKGKTEAGQDIIYVKGEITAIENENNVTFTMFDPNIGIEDIPQNYVKLTYELTELDSGTLLTIIQGDFNKTENAEKRFEESKAGWKMVIPAMEQLMNKKPAHNEK